VKTGTSPERPWQLRQLRVSRLPVDVEAVRMHVPVRQPRARRWLLAVAGLLAWQLVGVLAAGLRAEQRVRAEGLGSPPA